MKKKLYENTTKMITRYFGKENAAKLSMEMVDVDCVSVIDVKAFVQCVFCMKHRTKIFCRRSGNCSSYAWVLSNYKIHLTECVKKKKSTDTLNHVDEDAVSHEEKSSNKESDNCSLIGLKIESLLKPHHQSTPVSKNDSFKDHSDTISHLEDRLETQITVQMLKMSNTITANNEEHFECYFRIKSITSDQKLEVSTILGNGDCLFAAISHQIFFAKINSTNHQTSTMQLRQNVAEYIRNNPEVFENELIGRISDEKGDIKIEREEIESFLHRLSNTKMWGGVESLKAIGMIHKVNIICFNEGGDCYFINKFDPGFERSILIAYRLALLSNGGYSETIRNH